MKTVTYRQEPAGPLPVPSTSEVHRVIPAHCFQRSLRTSSKYAALSVSLTVGLGVLAWQLIPLTWAWAPVWLVYALVNGTVACGVWVIAHECGHGAFCDNKRVQDGIGFVLHSALLVPYFSWQRSHAIHHSKTNHLTQGETHVPRRSTSKEGRRSLAVQKRLGSFAHAGVTLSSRLVFGWPIYLLVGTTGGVDRGTTNHYWPYAPFSAALFPQRWARKVLFSSAGVLAMVALLVAWAVGSGSAATVLAVYGGPYLVCNAWLVSYTWLQHTNADIPHYDDPEWSFTRGAFCSVDRPYGPLFDLLHHRIGSTHVAHHLFAKIPHYHAKEATESIASAFPDLYRYDPTPVPTALWKAAKCVTVSPTEDGWRFSGAVDQP